MTPASVAPVAMEPVARRPASCRARTAIEDGRRANIDASVQRRHVAS